MIKNKTKSLVFEGFIHFAINSDCEFFLIKAMAYAFPPPEKNPVPEIGRSYQTGNVVFRDNAFYPFCQ